jgi:hypothetical protein
MEQLIFMISMPLYSVRGTLQIRLEESFKGWKQRKLYTILSLLTMATKRIIVIFTRYELNYNFHVSGIPP